MANLRFGLTSLLLLCSFQLGFSQGGYQATVSVDKVVKRDVVESLEIVGTVNALKRSHLSVEVPGLVAEKTYHIGKFVKKGDVLLRLRSDQAKLAWDAAKFRLSQMQVQSQRSKKIFERSSSLHKAGHLSAEDFEHDQSQALSHQKQVEAQSAEVARLANVLDMHAVKAPFNGMITDNATATGSWLAPGQALAVLEHLGKVYVEIELPEIKLHKFDREATVSFRADAWPGVVFKGKCEGIAPSKSRDSRSLRLRYVVDNPGHKLLAGMSLRGKVNMKVKPGALLVPKDAIVSRGPMKLIFIADKGVAKQVMVQILGYFEKYVIVAAKLEAGSDVVIKGNEFLGPGIPLNIVKPQISK